MTDRIQKTRFDGDAPSEPHLIVHHRPGQAMAIPKGATIGIVMDPTRQSPHFKMWIKDIKESVLTFRCQCNPTCTVEWVYKLQPVKGTHAK